MSAESTDARGEARQSFYVKQQLIAAAKTTFQQLAAVIKNATVYPAAHPFLLASANQLLDRIKELLRHRARRWHSIWSAANCSSRPLSVPIDQSLSMLMEQFTSRDVGGVIFKPGLTREEIVKFAYLMNKDTAYFVRTGRCCRGHREGTDRPYRPPPGDPCRQKVRQRHQGSEEKVEQRSSWMPWTRSRRSSSPYTSIRRQHEAVSTVVHEHGGQYSAIIATR